MTSTILIFVPVFILTTADGDIIEADGTARYKTYSNCMEDLEMHVYDVNKHIALERKRGVDVPYVGIKGYCEKRKLHD